MALTARPSPPITFKLAREVMGIWTLSLMRNLCQCPITALRVWKMYGHAATVCIRSVVTIVITSIIITTVMTLLQHVLGCETDTWTHALTRHGHHHQLGPSVRVRVAQRHMMVVFFQASFASAPGGRPRLPMLRRLALWKCTANINLPDLYYTHFIPSLVFPGFLVS